MTGFLDKMLEIHLAIDNLAEEVPEHIHPFKTLFQVERKWDVNDDYHPVSFEYGKLTISNDEAGSLIIKHDLWAVILKHDGGESWVETRGLPANPVSAEINLKRLADELKIYSIETKMVSDYSKKMERAMCE